MMRLLAVLATGACARSLAAAPSAQLADPRASHSATVLSDGSILVAGGFRKGPDGYSQLYAATTEIVDPAGRVRAGPPLVDARAGHVAVTLRDGRILLAGGWNANGLVRSTEVYDPASRTFARTGDLAIARGGAAATVLPDGRVLICGGGDGVATASAELFDPRDAKFHATGSMRIARVGHTATLLGDGTVLVVRLAARARGRRIRRDLRSSTRRVSPDERLNRAV
jgi:hypothetical protein